MFNYLKSLSLRDNLLLITPIAIIVFSSILSIIDYLNHTPFKNKEVVIVSEKKYPEHIMFFGNTSILEKEKTIYNIEIDKKLYELILKKDIYNPSDKILIDYKLTNYTNKVFDIKNVK